MEEPLAGAWLVPTGGDERFPLAAGQSWTIGRGEGCEVRLVDSSVSRLHALIQRRDGGEYHLVDLGSRNGSFINGRRVGFPVRLNDKDCLRFGDREFSFQNPAPQAGPVPVEASLPTVVQQTHTLATIVVVDIRDFTPLARTLPEELLAQAIGGWFLRVGQITQQYGSWAQKYIGDAVMAVWVHSDAAQVKADVERALQAVCEIHTAGSEVGRKLSLPVPLEVGAGVNTGPTIIGGSDNTALGNTVNAAFRMEAATKSIGLDVVLGQEAFGALGEVEPNPFQQFDLSLKGYDTLCRAWAIRFEELAAFMRSRANRPSTAREITE